MRQSTIQNALPIVAAAYGRRFGVQVRVGGTQASTDGQAIRIPAIDDTPIARTLAWGYLTHEAAHLRFTDFAVWNRAIKQGPLLKALLNILEDVRVERAIMHPYPGTKRTLDAVNTWLADAGLMRPPTESESPPRVLGSALLVMLMYRVRRQEDFTGHRGGVGARAAPGLSPALHASSDCAPGGGPAARQHRVGRRPGGAHRRPDSGGSRTARTGRFRSRSVPRVRRGWGKRGGRPTGWG